VSSLGDYLQTASPGSLNGFIFLDSQDWMPPQVIEDLWREVVRVGAPGTRVIFRTAGEKSPVEAALSPATRSRFFYNTQRSIELHKQDRSSIYGMFHLYEMLDAPVATEEPALAAQPASS
jgi:S-adenosylmethionine-diacylglycerol 3-amino-3-carboxypropyl transferase